jgi:hypothetical protein
MLTGGARLAAKLCEFTEILAVIPPLHPSHKLGAIALKVCDIIQFITPQLLSS